MGSTREKRALTRLIQDNIVHLCKVNAIYGGQFEVDGIICISGQREGQELIVKVHEKFGSPWPGCPPRSQYDIDKENNNSQLEFFKGIPPAFYVHRPQDREAALAATAPAAPKADYDSEMLDLSMHSSRGKEERPRELYNLASSNPHKRMRPEPNGQSSYEYRNGDHDNDMDRSCNTSPSIDEQAENLSMSASNSEEGSPDKAMYMGKSAFLASPFHLPKKSPLKSDRWTPSTPLPTSPECRQCGFSFESFEVLSEHNEAVHSVFTCQHCHKTFTSRSNLERHARLHTGFKPYVCAICQKAFSRKDHLSNHSAKHAYKCGNCNKRYTDKPSLASHFTYEHDSILTNCCEFCNKGFGNLESYEEHVKTHPQYHAVQKTYQSNTNTNNTPRQGLPNHTASPKKYPCDACKFVSQDRLTLTKHRLVHVEGQRCYTCLSCTKRFDDPLRYEEHLLSHQGEPNIYECTICRQIFPSMEVLRRHEPVHLSEDMGELMTSSMYSCPHCEKAFRSLTCLQEHVALHNSHTNKFRCLFCNLGFGTYSELCRHMEELRHYPPDPRMLFGIGSSLENRKYNEYMAKRNLQKELLAGKPKETQVMPAREEVIKEPRSDQQQPEVDNDDEPKVEAERSQLAVENDLGSDIEVVEPEAPEEHAEGQEMLSHEGRESYSQFVVEADHREMHEEAARGTEDDHLDKQDEEDNHGDEAGENLVRQPEGRNHVGAEDDDNKADDLHSPQSTEGQEGDESGASVNGIADTKASDRARKRKGPSPEKYVDGSDTTPMDSSLSEYYDNYDVESVASENSNPAGNLPLMLQGHVPSPNSDNKMHRIIDRKPREGSKTAPSKMSFDIPPGPHTCSVCHVTMANFTALEQHCFAEHNRCPCMFCPKTFAQKANRDRHICLHTGDKPYSCPECGEKFSRGDKLKLHRVRTHNISTTPTTHFTLKRDTLTPNGGRDWSIHSPTASQHDGDNWGVIRDESSNVVHGAGEWSMIQEGASY